MSLEALLFLGSVAVADASLADAAPAASEYERWAPSRDGIGKVCMGREISHVMGHRGARWLKRSERATTEKPDRVSPTTDIEEAIRFLLKKGYSAVPVVDEGGKLVCMLSEHDCVALLAQAAADRWPFGTVAEYMTSEVEVVDPSEDVLALSTRFSEGRHRRFFVVEAGRLVGLISRRDLLRARDSLEAKVEHKHRDTTYEAIAKRHRKLD